MHLPLLTLLNALDAFMHSLTFLLKAFGLLLLFFMLLRRGDCASQDRGEGTGFKSQHQTMTPAEMPQTWHLVFGMCIS